MKKSLLFPAILLGTSLFAQQYAKGWHLQYSPKDTLFGIDLNTALKEVPQPSTAKPVIVAVIDGGVDISHPDIAPNLWINKAEVPNNGVDDDHNGYVDDIYGWDFLGSASEDIQYDNLESTRKLRELGKKFEGKKSSQIAKADKADYKLYKKLISEHEKEEKVASTLLQRFSVFHKYVKALTDELDSTNITLAQLKAFEPKSSEAKVGHSFIVGNCQATGTSPKAFIDNINEGYDHFYYQVKYHLNLDFDPRSTIGDDYENTGDKNYGNHEVKGPSAEHGTHVAGIIGAARNNFGIDGIDPLVQIMTLRVVPDGDERDKDVALAIRYAVDNGAKVINMSFGKDYVHNKAVVDEAVKYAASKDVLIIHAAGNDAKNIDKANNYPTPRYTDGNTSKNWIEVGASDRDQNPADFSNYGHMTVDVFAPGVNIYSTVPDNKYKDNSGTSMASPVVAGVAALIRAYFPNLTAEQVKYCIESTVTKPAQKVHKPGKKRKKTRYSKLCKTAGIVNAAAALKAASQLK